MAGLLEFPTEEFASLDRSLLEAQCPFIHRPMWWHVLNIALKMIQSVGRFADFFQALASVAEALLGHV